MFEALTKRHEGEKIAEHIALDIGLPEPWPKTIFRLHIKDEQLRLLGRLVKPEFVEQAHKTLSALL